MIVDWPRGMIYAVVGTQIRAFRTNPGHFTQTDSDGGSRIAEDIR